MNDGPRTDCPEIEACLVRDCTGNSRFQVLGSIKLPFGSSGEPMTLRHL